MKKMWTRLANYFLSIEDKDMVEEERKRMEEAVQMGPGAWTGMGKVKVRPCLTIWTEDILA